MPHRSLRTIYGCCNQVKMAVQYMRRVIEKQAKFDIMDLNCLLNLLYEILSSLCSATIDATSLPSAVPTISATKSVCELLSEVALVTDIDTMHVNEEVGHDEPTDVQDKVNGQIEDCCSYTSSNRESWGRCSSLGGSDEESFANLRADDNLSQDTLKAFATPTRSMDEKSLEPKEDEKKDKKKKNKKK